jgi:hypothetical protein
MSWKSWLASLRALVSGSGSRRSQRKSPITNARLGLESLEDRCVPTASVTYLNGAFDLTAYGPTNVQLTGTGTNAVAVTLTNDTFGQAGQSIPGITWISPSELLTVSPQGFSVQTGGAISVNGANIYVAAGSITLKGHGDASSPVGVSVNSGSWLTGNSVTITGYGYDSGWNNNDGVVVSGAHVTGYNGVTITGYGDGIGGHEDGVLIINGAWVGGDSGTVTITGNGSYYGSSDSHGVWISDPGTTVWAESGGVVISGTGRGFGSYDWGVAVAAGATVSTTMFTGHGNVTITGSSSGGLWGGGSETGVLILSGSHVASAGNLTVSGYASGYGPGNYNDGVYINGANLSAPSGINWITGYGGGSGNSAVNYGVMVCGGAQVTGSDVWLNGTGGSTGGGNNAGVVITDWSTLVNAQYGLSIAGQGQGRGWWDDGVDVWNGAIAQGMWCQFKANRSSRGTGTSFGLRVDNSSLIQAPEGVFGTVDGRWVEASIPHQPGKWELDPRGHIGNSNDYQFCNTYIQ